MAKKRPTKLSPQGKVLCRTLLRFMRDHPKILVGTLSPGMTFNDDDIESILAGFDLNLRRWHEQEIERSDS